VPEIVERIAAAALTLSKVDVDHRDLRLAISSIPLAWSSRGVIRAFSTRNARLSRAQDETARSGVSR
jgi:hypothetical protein